jgi:hypothetical protein
MERHTRVCHRHHTDPHEVGILRLHHRAIRHFGAVWRLLCDDCGVRGRDTDRGAVYCKRAASVEWRGEESRECSLKGKRGRDRDVQQETKRSCIIQTHEGWALDEWRRCIGIRILRGRRIAGLRSYSSLLYTWTKRLQPCFSNKSR